MTPAACADAWHAVAGTAQDALLCGQDVPPVGLVCMPCAQASESSIAEDAERLAEDKALVLEVVAATGVAILTGAGTTA